MQGWDSSIRPLQPLTKKRLLSPTLSVKLRVIFQKNHFNIDFAKISWSI